MDQMRHTSVQRVCKIVALTACTAVLVGAPASPVAAVDAGDASCINALNRSALRVATAVGHNSAACLKDAAAGTLRDGLAAQACLEADYVGYLSAAAHRSEQAYAAKCASAPPFGPSDARTVNGAAITEGLGLLADLFGDDLAGAVTPTAEDPAMAGCQRVVRRKAHKLMRVRFKQFVRCKRRGLLDGSITSADGLEACLETVRRDENGRARRFVGMLDAALVTRCGAPAIEAVFPGSCDHGPPMTSCLDARASCRLCRILHTADGLTSDCDQHDDGVANGSCDPPGPVSGICGNGAVEPGEDCDDAGGCCAPDCVFRAERYACASDGIVCTADVCDGAGACVHEFLCEWRFTEVTAAAGIEYEHAYDRMSYEGPTLDRAIIASGVAAGDYDGDGWVDLYATGGPEGSNRLLRNLGDGTFEDVAAAAGVGLAGSFGAGAVFADYDGDGHLDLLVSGVLETPLVVFRNLGDGTFSDATASTGIDVTADTFSAAFGDYDGDGDLDVALTHWQQDITESARLWRNDDGSFVDVTAEADLDIGRGLFDLDWSFTATFADINEDGLPDLLLAGDFSGSQVFVNDGDGTFTDATGEMIDDENGMGSAVGDYDNDGDLDWFVSSIWDPDGVAESNWGVTGNRLYQNQGDGTFADVTEVAGVREGYWGWGSCFADFNLDGDLDIFHVNGYSTNSAVEYFHDPARLFVSNGDGTFTESSAEVALEERGQGRGIACFDYDRDGDIDIFVANNGSTPSLWRNDATAELRNGFLAIELRAGPPNTRAIGARVYVTTGSTTQMREVRAGNNFLSNNPAEAHFGLGEIELIDEIRIEWPDGEVTTLVDEWPSQRMLILHPAIVSMQFTDVADEAGVTYLQRADPVVAVQPPESAEQPTGGAAAGDYDADGWTDLLVTRGDAPPILFRNDGPAGTFSDVTDTAGDLATSLPLGSNGAAWGDIDNDGDLDLYVTSYGTTRWHLFINDGAGSFTEEGLERGAALETGYDHFGMGVAFGDYDRDGYLDIFVTEWWAHPLPPRAPLPGESQNRLLRNLGETSPGHFVDVTEDSGIEVEVLPLPLSVLGTPGFSPGFVDFDDDGWPEIAWVADWAHSRLFWNNADGTFTDGTVAAGVGLERAGMGSTQDDFDGDGLIDWHVTAIFGRPDEIQFGVSSQLYVNNGDRTFTNRTTAAGVANAGFGWGTSGFDFDNDGDVDIIATNGMLQPDHPLETAWMVDRTRLFENLGDATFIETGQSRGIVDRQLGRGVVTFDYDRDGDRDVFVANHGGTPHLYRNDGGNSRSWVQVSLIGTESNRDGIGAVIVVDPDAGETGDEQTRQLLNNSNFVSHDELVEHFGLGEHERDIDLITVRWPSGIVQTVEGQPTRQRITVTEPSLE